MAPLDIKPGDKFIDPKNGELVEFSRIGGTGLAILHPPGDPDMQSSFAVSLTELKQWKRPY